MVRDRSPTCTVSVETSCAPVRYAMKSDALSSARATAQTVGEKLATKGRGPRVHLLIEGIADYSLDGSTCVAVDTHTPEREDDSESYVSPVLAEGSQTFSVTVTGTTNSSNTDTNIKADHVVVTP